MKHFIVLLLAAFTLQTADAQRLFETYKGKINRLEKKQAKDTSDIVLDPIEQIPQGGLSSFNIAATQSNWGVDLLRNAAVLARIKAECKGKVTVKVADTGFKWDHFDLLTGQLPGSNYTTDANNTDQNGHSTHCAGIIGARDLGYTWPLVQLGIVSLKPVQVLAGNGSGNFDWVKNAVAAEREDDRQRLARGEAVVWSGSFGGGTAKIANVEAEIQKSTDLGVLFVFAAGNTGVTGVGYPGCGAYSIAVGSLDQNLTVSSYSTRGPEVWIAAPGRSINSTYKGNTYATLSGTSMATPAEAAMLTIALSKWGRTYLSNYLQARAYLAWCASDIAPTGKDNDTGFGLDYITAILDKNPKDTPTGIPDNPPPPPPAPVRDTRFLTFDLTDGYDVYWSLAQAAQQAAKPITFKTAGKGSKAKKSALALTKTTLTSITVEVESKNALGIEYVATRDAVKSFFTNRGFGLIDPNSDGADAAYWAAYFLEMILQQDKKLSLDVVALTGKDDKGNPIRYEKSRLKHWPVK